MMNDVRKTRPAWPRTPKSTKQNLSTSSILPSQNYKKIKVSLNHFALLVTDDNNDISVIMPFINIKNDPDEHVSHWTSHQASSSTYQHQEHFKLLCFQYGINQHLKQIAVDV